MKNTQRAVVNLLPNGVYRKEFRHRNAAQRFSTEVMVLRYLEWRECPFVPRLLDCNPRTLTIATSDCGRPAENLSEWRVAELFSELETYGVRHEDAHLRNVTYDLRKGCFCIIDFEFATILEKVDPEQAGYKLLHDIEAHLDHLETRLSEW